MTGVQTCALPICFPVTIAPTPSITPSITPTIPVTLSPTPTPTPAPSATPGVTPTLGPGIIITGTGNDFCAYGCYTLTFVGRLTYSLYINGVLYRVTDDVIQYTSNYVPPPRNLAQLTS